MYSFFRKFTGIVFIIFALYSCGAEGQGGNSAEKPAEDSEIKQADIVFEKDVHNFGNIIMGERVSYGFRFTNEGNSPLVITGIRSGCGCTIGDYPKDPLMPGEQGRIDVIFNSAGRRGFQSESVRVLSNAQEPVINLRITAEVLER